MQKIVILLVNNVNTYSHNATFRCYFAVPDTNWHAISPTRDDRDRPVQAGPVLVRPYLDNQEGAQGVFRRAGDEYAVSDVLSARG